MLENPSHKQSDTSSLDKFSPFSDKGQPEHSSAWILDLNQTFQFGDSRSNKFTSGSDSEAFFLVCDQLPAIQERDQAHVADNRANKYDFDTAVKDSNDYHSDTSSKGDKFKSIEELKSHLKEGMDYSVKTVDRKSKVTIAAPHGGFVEPGSSELAKAIAGEDFNLYDFQGLDSNDVTPKS